MSERPQAPPISDARHAISLRMALGYFAAAAAWIVGTDFAVALFTDDDRTLWPSIAKGLAFCAVTAALVYGLVRRAILHSRALESERAALGDERASLGRARRRYEERLDLALRATGTGVWEWDVRTDAVFWSPEAQAIIGAGESDVTLEDFRRRVHPDDLPAVMAAARAAIEQRTEFAMEFRAVLPDGTVRWLGNLARAEYDAQGAPLRMVGTVRDVTAGRAAAAALRDSEARFRAIIEQTISGTCLVDADGRFMYANPRLAAILGYERGEDLVGARMLDLVAEGDRARVERHLADRLAGVPAGERYHFRARRKDGSGVVLGAQGARGSYDGRPVVIATVQDLTELRRAEEENERTLARLHRAVQGTIGVVSAMGELRDAYTHGHERRVGEVATAIAAELGLAAQQVEGVRVAGYLHDVGKIAVPAEILSKPGRLSPTEFALVKQHAQQGYEILKTAAFPWPVAEAAWAHHERLDGSGYPHGLTGDQMLFEARILAVADVFEAMSSARPYRNAQGAGVALAELRRHAGVKYDARVVAECEAWSHERRENPPPYSAAGKEKLSAVPPAP